MSEYQRMSGWIQRVQEDFAYKYREAMDNGYTWARALITGRGVPKIPSKGGIFRNQAQISIFPISSGKGERYSLGVSCPLCDENIGTISVFGGGPGDGMAISIRYLTCSDEKAKESHEVLFATLNLLINCDGSQNNFKMAVEMINKGFGEWFDLYGKKPITKGKILKKKYREYDVVWSNIIGEGLYRLVFSKMKLGPNPIKLIEKTKITTEFF